MICKLPKKHENCTSLSPNLINSFFHSPKFGKVIELTNDMFLNEIDKENKNVTIIVHIYDQVCIFFLLKRNESIYK